MLICRSSVLRDGKPREGVPLSALDSYRPLDADNAGYSLKGCLDAMIDAGVLLTDRASRVRVLGVEFESVANHSLEGVRVEVEN